MNGDDSAGPVTHHHRQPAAGRKDWIRQHRKVAAAAGTAAGVLIVVAVLWAVGVFSAGPLTIRGVVENDSQYTISNTGSNTWVADSGKLGRCLDSETINVMVTVGGRSVTIATGSLPGEGFGSALTGTCDTDFTIRGVPGGYASYGLQIADVPGTVNFTATQLAKPVGLTISSGS